MSKTALIVGASGLVGSACLDLLLAEISYQVVKVLVRKPIDLKHPKLQQIVVNFDRLEDFKESIVGDEIFCCLGTTIKVAGTKENFYKVDFTYAFETAKIALANGAKGFYLVSSMGADAKSFIFYSKVKGELENTIKALQYPVFYIFRPSLLLGNRKEHRAGEKLGISIYNFLKPIFIGPLEKYKGIEANKVAKAMVLKSIQPIEGTHILLSDEIQRIG